MDRDETARQCGEMGDRELVRTLTLDREEYSDRFYETASQELSRRGIVLPEFLDRVEISLNDREPERCTIARTLEKLDGRIGLWDVWAFTGCLDESLVLQRESRRWTVHHYGTEGYEMSFFVETQEEARELLSRFLSLEDWQDAADPAYNFDEWRILAQSKSREYIGKIAAELDLSGVPNTVQTPIFSQDRQGLLAVLIPDEDADAGNEVMRIIEEKVDALYARASELAENGDPEEELEVYDLLAQLEPDNPTVHYDRGSILFELGRYEEAVDSFVGAVAPTLEAARQAGRPAPKHTPGGRGGMVGMISSLFKKANRSGGKSQRYPDFVDDAEAFLLQILRELPQNVKALHCLAAISRLKDDFSGAAERYRAILKIDPSDDIARLSLGHLQDTIDDR